MLVSVIIPTYNGAKTIARALDSVFAQQGAGKEFDLEVMVCDDASTDDTLDIVSRYPDVKIMKSVINSGGPNHGRNLGIRSATGDVITFLDQDDQWLPAKTLRQLKEINDGYEFIYSPSIKIVEDGR